MEASRIVVLGLGHRAHVPSHGSGGGQSAVVKLSGVLAALNPGNITKRYRVCVWWHDENGTRGHNTCFWLKSNAMTFYNRVAGPIYHVTLRDDWTDREIGWTRGIMYGGPR
jgi:hypothetical protein